MIFPALIFVKQMLKQHYTHLHGISLKPDRFSKCRYISWCVSQSMTFTVPVFRKLIIAEWQHMKILCSFTQISGQMYRFWAENHLLL